MLPSSVIRSICTGWRTATSDLPSELPGKRHDYETNATNSTVPQGARDSLRELLPSGHAGSLLDPSFKIPTNKFNRRHDKFCVRAWCSLVASLIWNQVVAGSNPAVLTENLYDVWQFRVSV